MFLVGIGGHTKLHVLSFIFCLGVTLIFKVEHQLFGMALMSKRKMHRQNYEKGLLYICLQSENQTQMSHLVFGKMADSICQWTMKTYSYFHNEYYIFTDGELRSLIPFLIVKFNILFFNLI